LIRAVIVGSAGQDGSLLAEQLAAEGASIVSVSRDSMDIRDGREVISLLERFRPHEVYYLPAYHRSAEQQIGIAPADIWRHSLDVHVLGLINFLEAIRLQSPETRLFYACSSLVFGHPSSARQNELTPLDPRSPYAITKAAGWQCCRMYRSSHSVFAAVGILYNHESHLRPDSFVSQKIVRAAVRIRGGELRELVLGDLSTRVDWGYAPDYVRAMTAILRLQQADDFVIATGDSHSVADFARLAFEANGLDWKDYVREQAGLLSEPRPSLVGDASKLRLRTGWCPSLTFGEMVGTLVAKQLATIDAK
jgi:GDPmannose 4,6-dehydratase